MQAYNIHKENLAKKYVTILQALLDTVLEKMIVKT